MLNLFTQSNYTFEGQRPGEVSEIFLYQHWITIFLRLLTLALFLLFPIIPLFIFSGLITTYNLESLTFFILVVYYLFIWSNAFFSITMYLLDAWIVTGERIIDMKQNGLFSRTESEMSLTKVQDISVKVSGFLATLFNYGNVEIQSAGTVDKFVFKKIANPARVKDQIVDLVRQAKEKEGVHDL